MNKDNSFYNRATKFATWLLVPGLLSVSALAYAATRPMERVAPLAEVETVETPVARPTTVAPVAIREVQAPKSVSAVPAKPASKPAKVRVCQDETIGRLASSTTKRSTIEYAAVAKVRVCRWQ